MVGGESLIERGGPILGEQFGESVQSFANENVGSSQGHAPEQARERDPS